MAEPKYCPKPNIRELLFAALPPGTFGFFMACQPGTMRQIYCTRSDLCAQGCPVDKAFVPIKITWTQVLSEGWTAPGGNRYWSTSLPADPRDPRVSTIFYMLAGRSASSFVDIWGSVKNKTMKDVMVAGTWVAQFGLMTVPVAPIPTETPVAFIARGGYLLDLRPGYSPILGPPGGRVSDAHDGVKWQSQGATVYPWLADTNVKSAQLWGHYDAAGGKVNYTLRIVYKGSWEKAVNSVGNGIDAALSSFCGKLAQNAGYAATAATTFPSLAPYMAVYASALAVCNIAINQLPPTPCIPREPTPNDYMAMVAGALINISPGAGGGAGTPTAGNRPAAAPMPGMVLAPNAISQNPNNFPPGTITWQNPAGTGFELAVPQANGATLYRITQKGLTSAPGGARVVDRSEWEASTMRWVQRRTSKVSLGVAAALVTATAVTALAVRARNKE